MKKIITILVLFISAKCFSQVDNNFMQKNTFWDTTYFKNVPYSASAGVVHLGIDTVVSSPTFGKLVRKTASSGTSGIDDVLAVGQALTANRTISTGAFTLDVITATGGASPFSVSSTSGDAITASSTGGVAVNATGFVAGTFNSSGNSGITINATSGATPLKSNGDGGTNIYAQSIYSSTNSIETILEKVRGTSGTAANGIGQRTKNEIQADDGLNYDANTFISKYQNADNAGLTSQYLITGFTNTREDTLLALGGYVNLTESSATQFTSTLVGSGKIAGGQIIVTVEANDATDFQARTLRFIWSAVNKGGTTTVTISTPEETAAISNGSTLSVTITATDGGAGVVKFNANAVSSLSQSTLRCSYQTFKNF